MSLQWFWTGLFFMPLLCLHAGNDLSFEGLTQQPDNVMIPVVERFRTDSGDLKNFYEMPFSSVYLKRATAFADQWLAGLETIDFNKLSQDGKIDWLLLRNKLQNHKRSMKERALREKEVAVLIPFGETIAQLEENRMVMKTILPKDAAATLVSMKKELDATRKQLSATMTNDPDSISKPLVRRAIRILGDSMDTLQKWQEFYVGYDPQFTWWTEKPLKQFQQALKDYRDFLSTRVLGRKPGQDPPIVGDPIGSEAFKHALDTEMIPYTPEELIEIGYKELAWCKAEMKKAAAEMGLGDDWQAAMERTKQDHVSPGEQDDLIFEMAHEAVTFLEKHELVTIPDMAKELWEVKMMSLENQKFTPFFYYSPRHIAVAFPTDSMDQARKNMSLRANNKHFSRAVVHHELIPGHHLQYYMASRYAKHRGTFSTPFWGEGWALYWEMLLWDKKFQKSPENKMGMLFWRAHRCARIIVSLSFHLERMKPDEMVNFLVDEIGHERDSATAEIRRYVESTYYGPLYQCAYMLGGLQLRALHKELVLSGKMTNRDFHDTVLRNGRIPIEMVRAKLIQQELTKEFKTQWKFYEAL